MESSLVLLLAELQLNRVQVDELLAQLVESRVVWVQGLQEQLGTWVASQQVEHLFTSLSDFLGVGLLGLLLLERSPSISSRDLSIVHAFTTVPNSLGHIVVIHYFPVSDRLPLA